MQKTYDLIAFIEELRLLGFNAGTEEILAAQELVAALVAEEKFPDDPRRLRTLLAPILCSTPHDQELFYRKFDQWLTRNPRLADELKRIDATKGLEPGSVEQEWQRFTRRLMPWRWILVGGVLAGAVIAAVYFVTRSIPPISGVVMNEAQQPISSAKILFLAKETFSDSLGHFSFQRPARNDSSDMFIEHVDYKERMVPVDLANYQEPIKITLVRKEPRVVVLPPESGRPVEIPNRDAKSDSLSESTNLSQNFYPVIRLGLPIIPFVLFLAWWLWGLYRRRLVLERRATSKSPILDKFVVRGPADDLFTDARFRRTTQELRRHREVMSSELDVPATVDVTLERAGIFEPVYGTRQTLPEYLVLIDRASFHDQQARRVDEMLDHLEADGVIIDRYYFSGDPRICHTKDPYAPHISLFELTGRCPDYRLIIFTDAANFMNPMTGKPQRWLEQFDSWPERALLTPAPMVHWAYRELALADLGFTVLPSSKAGLAAFTDVLNLNTPKISGNGWSPAFPQMLVESTESRWLEHHAPYQGELDELCEQLRNYLGESGYYWLAACAVYPALHWDLTLYFGHELKDEDGTQILNEERLTSLARLPWFRHNTMPDWLRLHLISDMSRQQERKVRGVLSELLLSALERTEDGIVLDIARKPSSFTKRHWKTLLQDFLSGEKEMSPLRDYVFLAFLSGRKPGKLSPNLPQLLRRMFYRHGHSAMGVRPITALLLAAVLGFASWWGIPPQRFYIVLSGHADYVRSVAFGPDGQTLASGSFDESVRLWDVATGAEKSVLSGHSSNVNSVAFSPDGQTLASGSFDESVRLWDVATGTEQSVFSGHSSDVYSVAFSPDGQTLASGSDDNSVRLWDVATGKEKSVLSGHSYYVSSVAFSPDGQTLASGSGDNTIRLWDVATGKEKSVLSGHSRPVLSVAFSPDGQTLASGSGDSDNTIRLWDVATGKEKSVLSGHSHSVYSAAFSPDGQTLASGSSDQSVRLWDIATGKEKSVLSGHSDPVLSVAFSPDGQTLASGSENHTIRLWDVATGVAPDEIEYLLTVVKSWIDKKKGWITGIAVPILAGFLYLVRLRRKKKLKKQEQGFRFVAWVLGLYRGFVVWGAGIIIVLGVFLTFVAVGWPGEPDDCIYPTPPGCFCEAFDADEVRAGAPGVRQPVNTWFNLYAIITSFIVALFVTLDRKALGSGAPNLMRSSSSVPDLYIFAVLFLGLGSMWFHASLTRWAGIFDGVSMYVYAAFLTFYSIRRFWNSPTFFWIGYVVTIGLFTLLHLILPPFINILILVIAYLAVEVYIWVRTGKVMQGKPQTIALWLLGVTAILAATFFWWASQSGNFMCDPNSFFQPHGMLWHPLAGVVAVLLYFYWRAADDGKNLSQLINLQS